MEEDQYRDTYDALTPQRCVYEKAQLTAACRCTQAERFNLADREGVRCLSPLGHQHCQKFLDTVRENARFALRLTEIGGPLPHAAEIKVQAGGLIGLQQLLRPMVQSAATDDVFKLLNTAVERYTSIDDLPWSAIIPAITHYQGRRRR